MRNVLLIIVGLISSVFSQSAERPSLAGKITGTNGLAIMGATVLIYSAGPRVGSSTFCPTCYADCRKSDISGTNGSFKIESLDPKLIFRILVLKSGFRPLFVSKTDPLAGSIPIQIEPRVEDPKPFQHLSGQILDPEGKPLNRAIVEFDFFGGKDANCGGECEGVDLLSVTDEQGRFFIGSQKKFDWMDIRVEAGGFARKKFFRLSGEKSHELKLSEGAVVTGRILSDGKPAANVGVGLVSEDKGVNFTGNLDTSTDVEGRFTFYNVPPYQVYFAYTLMGKSPENLIVPAQRIRVAADGTRRDLGDISLSAGTRLRGRVVLSDGKPVPGATEIYLGREDAWDSRSAVLDREGQFDFKGVPTESVSVSVRIPGYRLSMKNKSLDRLNGGSIVGRVESDTFVEILLEPGEFKHPEFKNLPAGVDMQPRNKTLMGYEADSL